MDRKYSIGVIAGDGTGPEVIGEGMKVLRAAAEKYGFSLDFTEYDFGGERYLRTGELLSDEEVERLKSHSAIYLGAIGHPEVMGLLGQVDGDAVVIENMKMLEESVAGGAIDLQRPVEIFSQTTKSPAEYASICSRLEEMMASSNEMPITQFKGRNLLIVHNTICSQVATRHARLSRFALDHDIIIFVSGRASSNGKVLCDLCKSLNIRTYHISSVQELKKEWFRREDNVGVCGATSTPKWLLEQVAEAVRAFR